MDADTILRIKPTLTTFLHEFDDCFGRSQTRGHLATYVRGQLSDLPRKSVEPMADAAGVPERSLQQFLSLLRWNESMMRDRLQQHVARHHGHHHSVGIIDETSYVKKGDKTACVQRQHCGAAGKRENCVVSVHLGYAAPGTDPGPRGPGGFHTLLDGELYLPQHTWHEDRDRCREAGIPDEVVYRTKHDIALEQYRRAVANGVRFRWMTFDEFYGRSGPFLREFDAAGQDYVAEVPKNFHVWTQPPQVLHRRHDRDIRPTGRPGRPRKYPRLKVKNNPSVTVQNVLLHSPLMRKQPWVKYRIKDTSKGPMVWEAKRMLVYLKDENDLPVSASQGGAARAYHLLIARNVLNPSEVKYFISNASEDTPVETLLLVAFSRWKIERMFEDSKMELGLDHYEARKYQAISRHLLISCVSHLFLAEFHLERRGEKSGADDQPGGDGGVEAGDAVAARRSLLATTGRGASRATGVNAGPQRQSRPQPPQADSSRIARDWNHVEEPVPVSVGEDVAL